MQSLDERTVTAWLGGRESTIRFREIQHYETVNSKAETARARTAEDPNNGGPEQRRTQGQERNIERRNGAVCLSRSCRLGLPLFGSSVVRVLRCSGPPSFVPCAVQ